MKETDLYLPVKDFLAGQGYEVKSEVHVELKLSLTLDLSFQVGGRTSCEITSTHSGHPA